ncbi:MAG: D-alanyl-D-alanine carboxypeptidase [Acidobacteria bacterium]|nr:D-alanyl-D-alanine carboxypeptidase [Acidobacteriota bacterium]
MRRSLHLLLAWGLALPLLAGADFQAWVRRQEAKGTRVSAGLWDLATGKAVEGHHADTALVPASTTKVVSSYAILRTWKPDFLLETEAWGDLQGGAVRGDLVLKGGGDPFLTDERIWLLARELKAAGVLRVTGRLKLDQSAFDGQRFGNGWENTSANTTPPIAALSVNFNRDPAGRLVGDPDRLALDTLHRIFTEAGIAIEGGPPNGAPRKLLAFPSPPLRQLVGDINKFSNNFMIEMLVKRFGDGSWPRGIQRIQRFYQEAYALPPSKLAITDGSGLSKDNLLSAKTLAVVLRGAWHDFEVGPEFAASLKVIGGEPWKLRVKDPNLARRVRVKTGHLSGVSSACGYLQTPDGKLRVFAILLNGNCQENDVWEQVSRWAN